MTNATNTAASFLDTFRTSTAADLDRRTLLRISSIAPHRLVSRALAHGLITREEMDVYRDRDEHDAWFREIGERLDACRHEPQDRNRRAEIRNILDLYFAARREGFACGLC